MALTRITKGVIKPNENYDTHNINSTGIVTSVGLDVNGNADISGSLSVGGVLTYEDVTSIDSVGIITAQKDIHVGAGLSVVGVGTFGSLDIGGDIDVDGHTNLDNVSIAGVTTATGTLRVGTGHTFHDNGNAQIAGIATVYNQLNIPRYYGSGVPTGQYLEIGADEMVMYQRWNGSVSNIEFRKHSAFIGHTSSASGKTLTIQSGAITRFGYIQSNGGSGTYAEFNKAGTGGYVQLYGSGIGNKVLTTDTDGVNILKDLDVDGHTELDNANVSGIVTFSNTGTGIQMLNDKTIQFGSAAASRTSIYYDASSTRTRIRNFNDTLEIGYRNTEIHHTNVARLTFDSGNTFSTAANTNFLGTSYHAGWYPSSNGGTFKLNDNARLAFGNQGDINFFHNNSHFYLQNTTGNVNVTGNVVLNNDLDVDGHTNLDNVSVAGVGTFTGNVGIAQSIFHDGDTNTTIGFPANDQIKFHTGGVERLLFTNSYNWLKNYTFVNTTILADTPTFLVRNDTQSYHTIWESQNTNARSTIFQWNDYGNSGTAGNLIFRSRNSPYEEHARFTGAGNFNLLKDLDVDGHTNLDNLSVAGVSTFSGGAGAITIAADSDIRFTNTSNWSGEHAGKIQYFGNKLYLQGGSNGHQLRNHSGGTVFEIGSTGSCAGMDLTLAQDVTLNGDIDVDGHTNLDNVSIAGVTTFTGDGIFNGGAGAIRIGGACDIRFTSGAWTGESVKLQYHNDKFYWQTGANGWQFRDAAGAATLELSPAGVISGKDLTFSSEIKANNGAGAIRILGGSDIRFNTGNWTGEFSGKLQYHSDKFYWQTGANGWQFRDSSGTATIELSPAGAISGKNLTFSQDVSFSGGGGGCTISAGSDIRLGSGSWTGDAYGKIQHHSNQLYIGGGSSSTYSLIFRYNNQDRVYFKSDGTIWPQADSTSDLGLNDKRWANVYADTYYGDGSNLTGVTMTTINNNTNNYVITGTGTANTLQGESALTFSSGRLHSGAITLNDNGVSGALLNVRADDQGPWAFVIGNDTYHASSGLYGYQPNNGDFLLRLVGNSEYKSFTFEQHNGSSNRSWVEMGNGGNVKLFYQGGERLATTSTGLTMGGTGAFIPPIGTTAQRPSGSTGMVRYNSTTGQLEVYDGSAWANVNSQPFSGSGGSESLSSRSGYKVHTFTSPGTFTVTGDDTTKTIEVLVIGGGGAGGEGGGGAGALRFSNSFPVTPGNYTVTIGGGGSGNQGGGNGGSSSSFGNITAPGGGGGGGSSRANGQPGGSGGGCRRDNNGSRGNASGSSGGSNNSNSPSSGWGNRGGSGNVGTWCGGGGGGGAGGVGGQGNGGGANSERGGNGGSGLAYSINGSSTGRAGGGGGGCEGAGGPSGPGRGGNASSGGGRGGVSNQVPGNYGATAGSSNTGGGGGGNASTGYSGGNHSGGSGIVIVAYTV